MGLFRQVWLWVGGLSGNSQGTRRDSSVWTRRIFPGNTSCVCRAWRGGRQMVDRTMLLVVEDDPSIRELLATSLRFAGFEVNTAATGNEALRAVERRSPDLVLLDVMLPDRNGFDVLRWLRSGGQTVPVLFLTARDAAEDKITGLTIGGDDYVTKPFSLEEVIARVNAVLRRTRGTGEPAEAPLRYADLELHVDSHEVRRADKLVPLSPTEFKLLHYLMRNAGRVVSK